MISNDFVKGVACCLGLGSLMIKGLFGGRDAGVQDGCHG